MNISRPFLENRGRRLLKLTKVWLPGICLCLLYLSYFPPRALAVAPRYPLKLATLAPENSSLMQIFRQMNSALLQETGGQVGFRIFSGFVLGDERDVLRKLRIGLIQAATFTDAVLTDINPDIRVLHLPFLFNNYREVDYIRGKLDGVLRQGFARRGYEVLGWSELGFLYLMSTVPVARVADLKGVKVWTRANSPLANALFSRAQATPVTITAPDVLVALQTHLLQVVYNSPYYALVTQWYSRIKYLTDLPLAYIGGALVVSTRSLSRLSPRLRQITREVCARYLRRLTEKTRMDNEEALRIIFSRGVKRITPEPGEVEHFKLLVQEAIANLKPKLLPRELLRTVTSELEQYRARHQERP